MGVVIAAVILAIDPGKRAGWCIRGGGFPSYSGVAKSATDRRDVVQTAAANAEAAGVPLVAVVEMWTVGAGKSRKGRAGKSDGEHTRWTPSTMIGLGSGRGRWFEALELAGYPKARVVSVVPATWRRILDGLPRRSSAECKRSAMLVARGLMQRECGPDEAEAVCIAAWAERSPEVAAMAAKKTRKRKAA